MIPLAKILATWTHISPPLQTPISDYNRVFPANPPTQRPGGSGVDGYVFKFLRPQKIALNSQ